MPEFKKGDVVRLKSGGPKMTVSDVGDYTTSGGPEDGVHCVWFDLVKGVQKNSSDVFDAAVLEIAPTDRGIGGVSVRRS